MELQGLYPSMNVRSIHGYSCRNERCHSGLWDDWADWVVAGEKTWLLLFYKRAAADAMKLSLFTAFVLS